jgi:hypothetical protein
MADEESAFWHRSVIARRTISYFPPSPRSGPGAPISDPAKPVIVDGPEKPRRHLQHERPFGEIEETECINCIGVARQEQRLGIHQFGKDYDLVILYAGVYKAFVDRFSYARAAGEPSWSFMTRFDRPSPTPFALHNISLAQSTRFAVSSILPVRFS